MTLESLRGAIDAAVPDSVKSGAAGGFVCAVWQRGEQIDVAHGTANLNTGAAMTPATGWLLGSVTKVLTTSLLMRFVERGQVSLDEHVTTYLPDFRVGDGAESAITVRSLVNHTNGMDADTFMPTREFGPGAVKTYVDGLAELNVLFEHGELIHYTNPGFCTAGRILEVLTGTPYNELLERELFAPTGMDDSSTSATQAILRPTAIGAFPDGTGGGIPTRMFMLPVSGAPAGATAIVTTGDLVAFARMHLAGGVAPNGTRVLSEESVRAMQTVTFKTGYASMAPIGLGWWIADVSGTTMITHGGGSPGGLSSLAVFPEHDLVFAGFGTGAAMGLTRPVLQAVTREVLGLQTPAPPKPDRTPRDLSRYEGTYGQFQQTLDVTANGGVLEVRSAFHAYDEEHARFLAGYAGLAAPVGSAQAGGPAPAARLVPVGDDVFAPEGAYDGDTPVGQGAVAVTSFHFADGDDRARWIHQGGRAMRRDHSPFGLRS